MTDLPDDVVNAAAEAIRARGRQLLGPQGPGLSDSKDLAITALAAASGPWAEQLDAAKAEMAVHRAHALADAENHGLELATEACKETVDALRADLDAALARNAELQAEAKAADEIVRHYNGTCEYRVERDALRAELDNLRETLAQKIETAVLPIDHTKTVTVVDVQRECAAIVRGSDDE